MARKKLFAVIGIGGFGGSVVRALAGLGYEVLAIDEDEYVVQEYANIATHVAQADATDEAALKALGVRNFDVAIVGMAKNLEASTLTTVLLKEMGVPYVISKAESELHGKILQKIGADRVVFPERDMGLRIAHNLVSSNILEYIELSPDYSILELNVPSSFVGKSLKDLELRNKYGMNVISIKRSDQMIVSPLAQEVLQEEDIIIAIAENEKLAVFENEKG